MCISVKKFGQCTHEDILVFMMAVYTYTCCTFTFQTTSAQLTHCSFLHAAYVDKQSCVLPLSSVSVHQQQTAEVVALPPPLVRKVSGGERSRSQYQPLYKCIFLLQIIIYKWWIIIHQTVHHVDQLELGAALQGQFMPCTNAPSYQVTARTESGSLSLVLVRFCITIPSRWWYKLCYAHSQSTRRAYSARISVQEGCNS